MAHPVKISVVVPTCDRPEPLKRCLAALAPGTQTWTAFETIVTDDGARGADAGAHPNVRFTRGPKRGPAANRNHGARLAAGDWIAFLDDDCVASPGWLAALAEIAAAGKHDLLEGKVVAAGWTGHPLDERVENMGGGVFWSCNLAVRREFFFEAGGFDEEFRQPAFEDMEFAARAKRLGARSAFVPGAMVEHPVRRLTLRQLWRRTLMTRWYALYLRKTRPEFGRTAMARHLIADFGRGLSRRAREFSAAEWPRDLFLAAWEIATFPVLLPYVCFWDAKFACSKLR